MRTVKKLRSKKVPATLELKGITTNNKPDSFPYSGMRIMGAIQISTGVLAFILGIVDLIMTLSSYDADTKKYGDKYDKVASMTLACSPLWCGIWFAVTGGMGACITRHKSQSLHFLKIAFLILNLLCCAVFGPACIFINGFISYTRRTEFNCDFQWIITLVIAFLGVLEIIMATASASVTCCCSPLNAGQVNVLVHPKNLNGGHLVMERESTELTNISSGSEEEKIDDRRNYRRKKQIQTQTDLYRQKQIETQTDRQIQRQKETQTDRLSPEIRPNERTNNHKSINHGHKNTQTVTPEIHAETHPKPYASFHTSTPLSKMFETSSSQRTPRVEVDVPIYNTFGDSTGHPKQQKWAVPPW
ncbi:hypothetical protein BgiBS90_003580 [Biomphalaria glabrata]|nr:hypothetical protein BgiBS90_003580 [Biomphalaria glabrata]